MMKTLYFARFPIYGGGGTVYPGGFLGGGWGVGGGAAVFVMVGGRCCTGPWR